MPDPSKKVVTRFAPSPTGYLHIGSARTALLNWAYARKHGGTFILRIEDTDKARSTPEATKRIIEDLQWLGIDWDEGPDPAAKDVYDIPSQKGDAKPYFQSQRDHLYKEYFEKLLAAGRAYPDEKGGGAYRFKTSGKDITVHDLVLGDVTIKADQLEDFIIMKGERAGGGASGGPTFHFANVVDDATMGVTHVLRAQEHLMNTPKHIALFEALGIPLPQYAHMPLIFNADGSKMSKRDKAKTARQGAAQWMKVQAETLDDFVARVQRRDAAERGLYEPYRELVPEKSIREILDKKSDDPSIAALIGRATDTAIPEIDVHDFLRNGYMKDVVLNYVSLLGWSPKGNIERFDLTFLAQNFDFSGIGKSNAKFDRVKLLAFNQETLAKLSPEDFFKAWDSYLRAFQPDFHGRFSEANLRLLAEAYRPRSKTLADPVTAGRFFTLADDAIEFDAKAVAKTLKANDNAGLKALREIGDALAKVQPWTPAAIHTAIEDLTKATGRGMGDVAQPLRVAVTGNTVSPAIHDTLAILGKQSTLARIERCIAVCG